MLKIPIFCQFAISSWKQKQIALSRNRTRVFPITSRAWITLVIGATTLVTWPPYGVSRILRGPYMGRFSFLLSVFRSLEAVLCPLCFVPPLSLFLSSSVPFPSFSYSSFFNLPFPVKRLITPGVAFDEFLASNFAFWVLLGRSSLSIKQGNL